MSESTPSVAVTSARTHRLALNKQRNKSQMYSIDNQRQVVMLRVLRSRWHGLRNSRQIEAGQAWHSGMASVLEARICHSCLSQEHSKMTIFLIIYMITGLQILCQRELLSKEK